MNKQKKELQKEKLLEIEQKYRKTIDDVQDIAKELSLYYPRDFIRRIFPIIHRMESFVKDFEVLKIETIFTKKKS
jgi:hypothetical protein